jgi:hypothetical protein
MASKSNYIVCQISVYADMPSLIVDVLRQIANVGWA